MERTSKNPGRFSLREDSQGEGGKTPLKNEKLFTFRKQKAPHCPINGGVAETAQTPHPQVGGTLKKKKGKNRFRPGNDVERETNSRKAMDRSGFSSKTDLTEEVATFGPEKIGPSQQPKKGETSPPTRGPRRNRESVQKKDKKTKVRPPQWSLLRSPLVVGEKKP